MKPIRVIDAGQISYAEAFDLQKRTVASVQAGGEETFWFVEHPHVITAGRNADGSALVADPRFIEARGVEIAETDRGGDVTYHGPGQIVGYPIIALEDTRRDVRRYVHDLEGVLIAALSQFDIAARRHPEHRGVWVEDRKIASLGIRISRWVTSHGFALNVCTDLSYFRLMHPCGIQGCEMTSVQREIGTSDSGAIRGAIVTEFERVFDRAVRMEQFREGSVSGHVG